MNNKLHTKVNGNCHIKIIKTEWKWKPRESSNIKKYLPRKTNPA